MDDLEARLRAVPLVPDPNGDDLSPYVADYPALAALVRGWLAEQMNVLCNMRTEQIQRHIDESAISMGLRAILAEKDAEIAALHEAGWGLAKALMNNLAWFNSLLSSNHDPGHLCSDCRMRRGLTAALAHPQVQAWLKEER